MASIDELLHLLDPSSGTSSFAVPATPDTSCDIDALLASLNLQKIRRYFHQVYWLEETKAAVRADDVEPGLKLENVAAHSWHVSDAVLLLAGRFQALDAARALKLAVLHDKLEIYTGDFDPVGSDGKGSSTHAFNRDARQRKVDLERQALDLYIGRLRPSLRAEQRDLFEESLLGTSREALFVKGVDKLQALAFVHEKKAGLITDDHIVFSIRYTYRGVELFAELREHYAHLLERFIRRVSERRQVQVQDLISEVAGRLTSRNNSPARNIRIALIGKSGAGKSEVSRHLVDAYGFSAIKTGAICRTISKLLFGNEDKSSTQRLDDVLTSIDPSIFLAASLRDAKLEANVVVDALRFSDDVRLIKSLEFRTIRVTCDERVRLRRLQTRGQQFDPLTDGKHRSEIELDSYVADYEIVNAGSLDDLGVAVSEIVQTLR